MGLGKKLRKGCWLGLTLIPTAFGAVSAAPEALAGSGKDARRLIEVVQAFQRHDCDAVLQIGAPLVDRPSPDLPGKQQAFAYELVANCEMQSELQDKAYKHLLRGTSFDDSSDELWLNRLGVELTTKRNEAAVVTIEEMNQGRGAALNAIPIGWIWELSRRLKNDGNSALRKRLLAVLAGPSYTPDEFDPPPEGFRYAYAAVLLEGGDREAARSIIARLNDPDLLIDASLDPRFRNFLPAEPDFRAAAERDLVSLQQAIGRHPDRLRPLLAAAQDLRMLGRPQEAVALLQTAAARIDDPKAFTDRADQLNWWWDALGRSYTMLGKYDEAMAAFAKGAALPEGAGLNVSQLINMGSAQILFGRNDAALATLAAFDDPKRKGSPYGEMQLRVARGCAHALAGHAEQAAVDIAYASDHAKDDPRAFNDLQLCAGDLDGAAATIIRRLDDADNRTAALRQLSDYDPRPAGFPVSPLESRTTALKQRQDVKAAIDRAGGVRRVHLQEQEL